ncbi:MAG: hypothetical protein GX938_09500 [Spirochaetales bacterium]|nr:hypothetical protein [Spirochaetales bacterium]
MGKAIITFANGEKLEVSAGQYLATIVKVELDSGASVGEGRIEQIGYHVSDGLIPDLVQIISTCEYFRLLESADKVYKSSAVVSIENI